MIYGYLIYIQLRTDDLAEEVALHRDAVQHVDVGLDQPAHHRLLFSWFVV